MGGLGPGIGGLEILVIGLLALIVVGPKDLPLLLRKVGKAVGKARAMAGNSAPALMSWRGNPNSMSCARKSRRCAPVRAWSRWGPRPTPPSVKSVTI